MSKRNAILAAATRSFSRNGYKETSMSDLSRMTGAAGGTIFHHFKNKEDLFLNILKDVQDTILGAFARHKETMKYDTGLDMVEGVIAFYLHLAGEMEDQFLMLHRHYPYQMAETNALCRSYLESVHNCLLDIFEQAIFVGVKDGTVNTAAPRNTAMIIFALVDGVARFNTYNIYHGASLYQDLILSCRKILNP
ncbi:MAG: TetR/AcrR family transcriptional regulator [Desulfobacter sp.]|nr:TetR/AcrR family transcriptional regulator [Desulfobacter sp.]